MHFALSRHRRPSVDYTPPHEYNTLNTYLRQTTVKTTKRNIYYFFFQTMTIQIHFGTVPKTENNVINRDRDRKTDAWIDDVVYYIDGWYTPNLFQGIRNNNCDGARAIFIGKNSDFRDRIGPRWYTVDNIRDTSKVYNMYIVKERDRS